MEDVQNEHLRNIAINAHIDHGKTTPLDWMLKQVGGYRSAARGHPAGIV